MHILIKWLLSALVIIVAAYILPGVHISDFLTAFVVAAVLGILNTFVKPILVILTLPLTLITFGLFLLVLNAIVILLVSAVVPGFKVDGFLWAILFSIVVSVINSFLNHTGVKS